MARYDERSGNLYVTELGRVASHYYIAHPTIVLFNEKLSKHMSEAELLSVVSNSAEFEQIAVRDDEVTELEDIRRESCEFDVAGGAENRHGKVNILLQAFISEAWPRSFSLTADMNYVAKNAPRITRGMFEIVLRRGWPSLAYQLLGRCGDDVGVCKCVSGGRWVVWM